jgi:hypothetical protein
MGSYVTPLIEQPNEDVRGFPDQPMQFHAASAARLSSHLKRESS